MKVRPVGRRPGDPDVTKRAILVAAQEQFGSLGFDRATIRAIAEAAGVDPALVIHHFTNKRQLFVEAHQLPIDPAELFGSIAALPTAERGHALALRYLTVFTRPGSQALSMLRAAATNEDAAKMLRQFIAAGLIDRASAIVEGPDPELRVALIGSHLFGLLFARELLGIEQLTTSSIETLASVVAPAIQQYIESGDYVALSGVA